MTWLDRNVTEIGGRRLQPETLMQGYGYFPGLSEGAVKCPLFQTSTFVFRSAAEGKRFFELAYGRRAPEPAERPGLIYSRINNPNLEILEDRLGIWEGAEALVFSSGMAAIATALFAYLRPADVVLYSSPVYGGTDYLFDKLLPQFGVRSVPFHAGADESAVRAALASARGLGRVACLYVETPANPTNDLVDLALMARLAEETQAATGVRPAILVDNTFLGPLWQRPLEHGCDVVLYSLPKYVGGHSDVVAGAALGSAAALAPILTVRTIFGTISDPHTAWLLMRSLETLKLRMTASAQGALKVAAFLRGHPRVAAVWYLGFLPEDHPDRPLFERQCKSAGSTFSFEVKGGEPEAFAALNRLEVIKLAVSLGGTESLASHPAAMTHSDVPAARRLELGITDNLIRVSIGVEDPDDLVADFRQALERA